MPRKNSYITITDQFCGAGGSSQGAKKVLDKVGGEIKLALNHWKLAIETHNTNFPDTYHECTDISACDPRRYPSTDILITSPECTTHSPAGGNNHKTLKKQMDLFETQAIDPATERSRATMWDVCRFAEYHNYNSIIVENVVEAKTRWVLFDEWLLCMHKLGYNHKCVYLNSMHCHPTPQSRDRMYIVFWKKNNKAPNLNYTPLSYCHKCEKNVHAIQTWKNPLKQFGKFRQQYVYCCSTCTSIVEPYYYAAFNCIDWSDIGMRIGDRSKPLAPNTVNRIQCGLDKYGKQPIIIHTAYSKEARGVWKSVFENGFTQTSIPTQALINHPFLVNTLNGLNDQTRIKSILDRAFAQTTFNGQMLINPFIIQLDHSKAPAKSKRLTDEMMTQTKADAIAMVNTPFIVNYHHSSDVNSINDAMPTQCCNDKYGLITNEAFNSFISYYYGNEQASHITEAIGTTTTKDRHSLVTYTEPKIEDCYYRMLKPREIKLAMAFNNDYIILGNSKDQVKQLGNAVTPPAMEWLVQQVTESLNLRA